MIAAVLSAGSWLLTSKVGRIVAIGVVLVAILLFLRGRWRADGAKAAIEAVDESAKKLKAKADAIRKNETDDTLDSLDDGSV